MKIGIDIQSTLGNKTGLGYYTSNLVQQLVKIDQENEYVFFNNGRQNDLRTLKGLFWDQVSLPFKAKNKKVDLIHKPAFSAPVLSHCKVVMTLHDLISIRFPENNRFVSGIYWRKWLPYTAKKVEFIITVSRYSKDEILDTLKIPDEKIEVIYEGIDTQKYRILESSKQLMNFKDKYKIDSKFILYVGSIERRKNINSLIKAFKILKQENKTDRKLVLVGKRTNYADELFQEIKGLLLEKEVIYLGYVKEKELPIIYNLAEVFVYPSLYEGFGLPILEAMACGAPVVASKATSIPEVVGDAGLLIDATNVEELANAINLVITDDDLRTQLVEKGLKQVDKFSWERTARETLDVYSRFK
ncbi:MAG: glycosyltransferase family 1 protein [bacterium]